MLVQQIVNSIFASNTYILSENNSDLVWLIDVGDIENVLKQIPNNKIINGVFITHPHYDHIYGLNKLINLNPDCTVFTSPEGEKGLFSEKLNLSFYHEEPLIFMGSSVVILHESERIGLFDNCFLETLETPGHNWGCLTFKIENYLFTGDSYIPGFDVVTKLKGGDREANKKSLQKIMNNITEKTIICPGHGAMTQITNVI